MVIWTALLYLKASFTNRYLFGGSFFFNSELEPKSSTISMNLSQSKKQKKERKILNAHTHRMSKRTPICNVNRNYIELNQNRKFTIPTEKICWRKLCNENIPICVCMRLMRTVVLHENSCCCCYRCFCCSHGCVYLLFGARYNQYR